MTIEQKSSSIDTYYYSYQKRWFDLLGALILFLLSLPVIIMITLLTILTAGLPFIYTQKRAGINQNPFIIYKFRTMKNNADQLKSKLKHLNQAPQPMFKIHNDPRFITIGKWLSLSGFDELPQLINVLKGNMSLVGPRPLPIDEASHIPENWLWRFKVKPGLFSYWSLNKNRHKSLEAWKDLERKTVCNGGVVFDARIILNNLINQVSVIVNKAR